MNWVDLVIITCAVGAALFGILKGGMAQVLSYAAFVVGLLMGALITPPIADKLGSSAGRSVVGLTLPFAFAIVLSAFGRKLGARVAASIRTPGLKQADKVGGAVFGVIVTLVGAWLLAGMLGPIGLPHVSTAIQRSAIASALIDHLPPAPLALARLQKTFVPTGVPPMLAELEPAPAPDVAIATAQEAQAAADAARPSVVKVVSQGCGRVATGTGFVVSDGVVVTNAHVVAGVDKPEIEDRKGTHPARIVLFDPDVDLAVLKTTKLAGRPLPLIRIEVGRGTRGAVVGFPGGGPYTSQPGAVLAGFDSLVGKDIYGSPDKVSRQVYQLKAKIRGGNSGGPFVTPKGEVAGVVFSSSAINGNIGYALTSAGVAPLIDKALPLKESASAGPCPNE